MGIFSRHKQLAEADLEPKTLSLIVTDVRTRKLAELKKESCGKLLKTTVIPCRYNFWDVLAAYLSKYGSVEAAMTMKAADGMANDDYILTVCFDREGFQTIPPYHYIPRTANNGSPRGQEVVLLGL